MMCLSVLSNRKAWYSAARSVLTLFAAGCMSLYFVFVLRLRQVDQVSAPFKKFDDLPYRTEGPKGNTLYTNQDSYVEYVFYLFVAPLLAALAMVLHSVVPAGNSRWEASVARWEAKVCRLLLWPVPGRQFFTYWCGGLNLAELIFVLAYISTTISRLQFYLSGRYTRYDALEQGVVFAGNNSRPLVNLNSWAICFGEAVLPCYAFLFWPCAHNSFVNYLFGIPWRAMIKYHRWMGHWTVFIMGMHATLFYFLWALRHQYVWAEFRSWEGNHPFLPGSLAGLCALILQATSIYYFRRKLFEVFYRVHIVMFLGILVFGSIHNSSGWVIFMPALMPWAADMVLRMCQASNLTTISSATTSADGSMASLGLTGAQGFKACPLHDIFLNIPSISRWQWHPFTVANTAGNTITVHTKRYGRFTREMIGQLAVGSALPVRVMGPIGLPGCAEKWRGYHTVLCIAGGIGISPVLGVLNDLIRERRQGGGSAGAAWPQRVMLVWSSRHKEEFTLLDEDFLAAANASDDSRWLDIQLHYTGKHIPESFSYTAGTLAAGKPNLAKLASLSADNDTDGTVPSSDSESSGSGGVDEKATIGGAIAGLAVGRPAPPGSGPPLTFPWMSPLGFSLARGVQPKVASAKQAVLIVLLAYIGCISCISLTSVYYAEPNLIGAFNKSGPWKSWKLGALWIVAGMIGALGLPVFATHTLAYWLYGRDLRANKRAAVAMAFPDPAKFHVTSAAAPPDVLTKSISGFSLVDITAAKQYAATLAGPQVGLLESGLLLDIHHNRPSIAAALKAAAVSAAGTSSDVGVLVGGPAGMVGATKLAVASANACRGKGTPRFVLHVETYEM